MTTKYSKDVEDKDKKDNELKMKYRSLLGGQKEAAGDLDDKGDLKGKYKKLLGYQMEDSEFSKKAKTEDEDYE